MSNETISVTVTAQDGTQQSFDSVRQAAMALGIDYTHFRVAKMRKAKSVKGLKVKFS